MKLTKNSRGYVVSSYVFLLFSVALIFSIYYANMSVYAGEDSTVRLNSGRVRYVSNNVRALLSSGVDCNDLENEIEDADNELRLGADVEIECFSGGVNGTIISPDGSVVEEWTL